MHRIRKKDLFSKTPHEEGRFGKLSFIAHGEGERETVSNLLNKLLQMDGRTGIVKRQILRKVTKERIS